MTNTITVAELIARYAHVPEVEERKRPHEVIRRGLSRGVPLEALLMQIEEQHLIRVLRDQGMDIGSRDGLWWVLETSIMITQRSGFNPANN